MVETKLFHADSLITLRDIPPNSIDSLITDPPAGISFMNKEWDKPTDFIKDMTAIYTECLRVLKPGAHGLVWAIPRTSHWTATALEQAGFEIRDCITHIFGSGFPKSLDVSKAIDKMHGAEREKVGDSRWANRTPNGCIGLMGNKFHKDNSITSPTTDEAKQWQGWGTAIKPASEHWVLVRKPLSEKTVAKNVLEWGCGALNIDESRIAHNGNIASAKTERSPKTKGIYSNFQSKDGQVTWAPDPAIGRFPANLVLSHNEDCELVGMKDIGSGDIKKGSTPRSNIGFKLSESSADRSNSIVNYGKETVEAWQCTEQCAVAMLDEQSGFSKGGSRKQKEKNFRGNGVGLNIVSGMTTAPVDYQDSGGASRFFYCAKSSRRDRGEGNIHPTVKSTRLMEYLIRLITPPQGTVLDPFMGSGSTGVAAKRLNFSFIGIEKDLDYYNISAARIECLQKT